MQPLGVALRYGNWGIRKERWNHPTMLAMAKSNEMGDIDCIGPGEICAIFGVGYPSMFVSEPWPSKQRASKQLISSTFPKGGSYFQGSHRSSKRTNDHSGMGELHFETYVSNEPKSITHTRGRPVLDRTPGLLEPGKDVGFENVVMGGIYEALEKGNLSGNTISGCRLVLKEGAFHAVELVFRLATIGAVRGAYKSARPVILDPSMTVLYLSITSQVIGSLNTRRCTIIDSERSTTCLDPLFNFVVPPKCEFSMEFKNHLPVLA
ncbi:hypothetical protein JOM56_004741 [Amanita muscaria]